MSTEDKLLASGLFVAGAVLPGGGYGTGVSVVRRMTVSANKAAGDAFRDTIADVLRRSGYDVATEVNKLTRFGWRRIDIEISKGGRVLGGIEPKLGGARYSPVQRAKDELLRLFGDLRDPGRTPYDVVVVRGP